MENQMKSNNPDINALADDARALMEATADVAGEKVSDARRRLAAALDSGKQLYGRVKNKAVEGAKAADECVHEHPYQAIGVAFGAGALLGYLLSRRSARD